MAAVDLSDLSEPGTDGLAHLAALARPRRSAEALQILHSIDARVAPVVLAGAQVVTVPGALGAALPGGGVRRGTVTRVGGLAGAGATTVALQIAAAVTGAGEWVVAVDPDGTLGGLAALEAGVAPERFALVRHLARDRWAVVVGALLDGVTGVIAAVPRNVRAGDARRLVARARERRALLVVMESGASWPVEAALHLHARGDHVEVIGKGAARQAARAG